MTPPRQLVTLAVRELFDRHTGLSIFMGFIPENPRFPLGVLHSIDGGGYTGPPLVGPEDDAAYVYQLDIVGTRVDQVEKGADECRDLFLGRNSDGSYKQEPEAIPGYAWMGRLPADTPGGVSVVKAPQGTICTAIQRYTAVLTPSQEG